MAYTKSRDMFKRDPTAKCQKWRHPGGDLQQWRPHGHQLPSQEVLTACGEHAAQQVLHGTLTDAPDQLTDAGYIGLDWLSPLWNGLPCKNQRDKRAIAALTTPRSEDDEELFTGFRELFHITEQLLPRGSPGPTGPPDGRPTNKDTASASRLLLTGVNEYLAHVPQIVHATLVQMAVAVPELPSPELPACCLDPLT